MSAARSATLSACIIARDEARRVPDCLASVRFCDEILLVDSGSSDDTVAIARAAGARVIEQPWLGFPAQRNVALANALGEWVLEIDADERVTPALGEEIRAFLSDPPDHVDIAAMPLRNVFLGRPLGPSAKYPEYRRRLFRRDAYRHDEARTVHESLVPHGSVHPFAGDLEHILAASVAEALRDAWSYARLEAGQMQSPRRPLSFIRGAILRPAAKFPYRMLVDGGWRDGGHGALKVAIDCGIDAVVWLRHMLGRRGQELGRSGVGASLHYGATSFRAGPPRVIGVAFGEAASAGARAWLAAVGGSGVDVTLLSDAAGEDPARTAVAASAPAGVRLRRLDSPAGPLSLIRALDAEEQLRTVDTVIAFGPRAHMLMRAVPPTLRGQLSGIGADSDPRTVRAFLEGRLAGRGDAGGQARPGVLATRGNGG